jgi:hypothetical protein
VSLISGRVSWLRGRDGHPEGVPPQVQLRERHLPGLTDMCHGWRRPDKELQRQEASREYETSMEDPCISAGYATVIEEARHELQRKEASRACETCMEYPCVLAGCATVTEDATSQTYFSSVTEDVASQTYFSSVTRMQPVKTDRFSSVTEDVASQTDWTTRMLDDQGC